MVWVISGLVSEGVYYIIIARQTGLSYGIRRNRCS